MIVFKPFGISHNLYVVQVFKGNNEEHNEAFEAPEKAFDYYAVWKVLEKGHREKQMFV